MFLAPRPPRSTPAHRHREGPGPLRALIACVLVVSHLSACVTWELQPLPPPTTPTEPAHMRVTRTDGATRTLYDAQITADSLIGYASREEVTRNSEQGRVALPLSQVKSVEIRETNKVKSAVAIGLLAGVVVTFMVAWIQFEPTN